MDNCSVQLPICNILLFVHVLPSIHTNLLSSLLAFKKLILRSRCLAHGKFSISSLFFFMFPIFILSNLCVLNSKNFYYFYITHLVSVKISLSVLCFPEIPTVSFFTVSFRTHYFETQATKVKQYRACTVPVWVTA